MKKQKYTLLTTTSLMLGLLLALLMALMVTHTSFADCGQAKTTVINCSAGTDNAIWSLLIIVLNILTGGVGIAAVGGIVYASILYASAADNASQVTKAKDMIRDIVIGIIAYALMYSLLQYLVPGGVFH